ncbi:MAG: hypothetical protein R6V58_16840 [Planctomycetota bacterium]
MKHTLVALAIIFLAVAAPAPALGAAKFIEEPATERVDGDVRITFTVDRPADVAVAIVDKEGRVARHLAAGALGENAPAPLAKNALSQTLTWDGRDDRGRRAPKGDYSVRVGLGLTAVFDKVLGWNPKMVGEIKALAVDGDGRLYCFNGYSVPGLVVFDREGEYVRTLIPHDATKARGIRTLRREDGERVPYLTNMRDPYPFVQLGISSLRSSGSMVVTPGGRVVIAGPKRTGVAVLGADGRIPERLLGAAALPAAAKGIAGLAAAADGKALYASAAGKQAAVYRIPWNGRPGRAKVFTTDLESAGELAADAEGNVYVCDRAAGCVAVFDSTGKPRRAIETKDAWQVAVHPKTGAVYVAARRSLTKFADWQSEAAGWTRPLPEVPGNTPPVMALDPTGETPVLWIGCPQQRNYSKYVLWRIEDLGEKPGEPTEFAYRGPNALYSPVHIAVDPARDEVYVREWRESWRGQWFKRIDGETGEMEKLPIRGNEMAIGPNGYLYCRKAQQVGSWITRYDHAGKVVPFKKVMNPPQAGDRPGLWVLDSLRGATAIGMKGFDVAPNGDLYVLRYFSARGGKGPWKKKGFEFPEFPPGVGFLTPLIDVYGPEAGLKTEGIVAYFKQGACGVEVDRGGNIYVSEHITPKGRYYAEPLADQLPTPTGAGNRLFELKNGRLNWYLFNTGSLFKFGPDGGTIRPAKETDPGAQFAGTRGNNTRYVTVKGALWQHFGVAPSPADTNRGHNGGCVCTNNRFDLDAFGRVYVPDVHRFCIDVLDANGNRLTSFGRYGNADDRRPGIPINWGSFVGWSRKAVYVCDNLNRRILRVRLEYHVEKAAKVPAG